MPRPVHFEIQADDPERAMRFYSKLFGWTFRKWDGPMPYWLVMTGPKEEPGIDGGLHPRMGPKPVDGQAVVAWVCTMGVENLDATILAVTSHGGTIAEPKMAIPGVGWMAYGKDTEGNLFGMMQDDPNAK